MMDLHSPSSSPTVQFPPVQPKILPFSSTSSQPNQQARAAQTVEGVFQPVACPPIIPHPGDSSHSQYGSPPVDLIDVPQPRASMSAPTQRPNINASRSDFSTYAREASSEYRQTESPVWMELLETLPGTASLVPDVDKIVLVCLRDRKCFIGRLSSVDQYANVVLNECVERVVVGEFYGDIPNNVNIIRGENVVFISELDLDKELPLTRLGAEEIFRLREKQEKEDRDKFEKRKEDLKLHGIHLPVKLDEFEES